MVITQIQGRSGGGGGGGGRIYITCCQRQCIKVRSASHRKTFLPSYFSYHDGLSWHLRALHCKFQMYKDCRSRGRHVLLSCSNFAHERNTYVHIGYTRLWSHSQAVRFQATHGIAS